MNGILTPSRLFRYALLGLPLGFVGLPLYMHLPNYYTQTMSLSLATIGGILFFTRLADCFIDPWIGYFSDRAPHRRYMAMWIASIVLALGICSLFALPSVFNRDTVILPLILLFAMTYIAYSVLMINFYASGVELATTPKETTAVSAAREGAIIVGVLMATSLPQLLMKFVDSHAAYMIFSYVFAGVMIIVAAITLKPSSQAPLRSTFPISPWEQITLSAPLRWLFSLFFLNAIPTAITTTLFLFYISDVLHLGGWAGFFLLTYFIFAILAMPFWAMISARLGKRQSLILSMLLAISSFAWAYGLDGSQTVAFFVICIISGIALGGDLTLLPSMLTDVLNDDNKQGGLEFGIWNFISKFSLALAAGISLPILDVMGYVPNNPTPAGLHALSFSYALLPCLFKILALALLCLSPITQPRRKL